MKTLAHKRLPFRQTSKIVTCTGCLLLAALGQHAFADVAATASANATVQAAGPRTGTNGTNFFNMEGSSNGAFASFGVLDFSASAFNPNGLTANGVTGSQLTLSLTENNSSFTAPTTLNFFLTTNTSVSISNVTGATYSPLRFDSANAASSPYGIDTQLGTAGNGLFNLGTGSFTSTGTAGTGTVDQYTLTLGDAATTNAFLAQLNSPTGDIRIVVSGTLAGGAATFTGATNATTAARPALAFNPTFAAGNPVYRQSTSGSWTPAGGTDWSSTAAGSGAQGWSNDGTATAIFTAAPTGAITIDSGNINAAGVQFDTDGYTISGSGAGNTLTLMGSHSLTVTNASDSATISAPIAGTVGLLKLGNGKLVLTGTNTYTGATTLGAGTVQISADANLGSTANALALSGGTLAVNSSLALDANRAITGTGGGLAVAAGQTLTVNGAVNMTGALALPGAGDVVLTNTATLGGVTFANPTKLSSNSDGSGILNTTGIVSATQSSGTAQLNANVLISGTTTFSVANAAATLQVTGAIGSGSNNAPTGTATLVKTGAGTLDLLGDGSVLAGAGTTPASVRQGVAGTSAATGGTLMVHTANGLGVGQYQLNNGTFVNASGAPQVFANGLSIGGGQVAGGAIFSGSASEFQGNVALFASGAAFQHVITVNAPTTFSGVFGVANAATTGLLVTGTSSLTLGGASGANTFKDNVTIDSSATLTLAKTGALAANPLVSLNAGGQLSLTLAPAGGATDAIGDSVFLNLQSGSHVALSISGATETVGGLELNGTIETAGLYGPVGTNINGVTETPYLTGSGIINNLGMTAAVPEPGTWVEIGLGLAALALRRRFVKKG